MDVKIQSVKFDADQKLLDFIEHKVNKLDRFVERATSAEVFLKLDKDLDKGNKVVTIRIAVPGDELVVEERSKSFEEAIDNGIDALKHQIARRKEKLVKA